MVVNDFNLVDIPVTPLEANSPTLIDPDAVLSLPVSRQLLKSIARRNAEIGEAKCVIVSAHLIATVSSLLGVSRERYTLPLRDQVNPRWISCGLGQDRISLIGPSPSSTSFRVLPNA
jgi:hypothetical protein